MTTAIDDSALASLPVFPLPDAVLFPGTVLPLHVFEQRYREMIADVLTEDGLLAIARLRPGYEQDYYGRPPLFDTAGVGCVLAHEELDDGRYNLLVRGLGRVHIEHELPPDQSYRRVRARLLADETSDRPDEIIAIHTQLLALCDRVAGAFGSEGDDLSEVVHAIDEPGRCADVVVAALVSDADARQELLATLDPADRLDAAVQQMARIARKVGGPSGLH